MLIRAQLNTIISILLLSLTVECQLDIINKRFSAGDYAVLYNVLSTYVCSSLYNETSVDTAVDR
jgi:hypothetical protein